MFQSNAPHANYHFSQMTADARTVAAALSYLLEAEPDLRRILYASTSDRIGGPDQVLARNERQLNVGNASSTSRPAAG